MGDIAFIPRVGAELAGYRLESVIERGGMSVVFAAEHLRMKRRVALKILSTALADDDRFRERFVNESRIAASIDHPNVIPIYDAGEEQGVLYIAMHYVSGSDLKALITKEAPLDVDRCVSIMSQVGGALDVAHQHGLIHRDIKPGNILVVPRPDEDSQDHIYLSDFGLTKHNESRSALTPTGQFLGTVDYVAPEQIEGNPVDARADIYSLGCVFYECLTGIPPYVKDEDIATLWAHLQQEPPKVTSQRADVPAVFDEVVATALAKSPDDRYPGCRAFVSAIRAAVARPRIELPGAPTRPAEHITAAAAASQPDAPGDVEEPSQATRASVDPPSDEQLPPAEPPPEEKAPAVALPWAVKRKPTEPPADETDLPDAPSQDPGATVAPPSGTSAPSIEQPSRVTRPSTQPPPETRPPAEPSPEEPRVPPVPPPSQETRPPSDPPSQETRPPAADAPAEPGPGRPDSLPPVAEPAGTARGASPPPSAAEPAVAAAAASGGRGAAGSSSPREGRAGRRRWAALALVVLVAGGVVAAVLLSGGSSDDSSKAPKAAAKPAGQPVTGDLAPLPLNRVKGAGDIALRLNGNVATVTVTANGLLDGSSHPLHIHAGKKGVCPPSSAARDHNGHLVISTLDGVPYYGPPVVSLTTKGSTGVGSILALTRFPRTGNITYTRRLELSSVVASYVRADNAVIVIHGVDYNGNGIYDNTLDRSDLKRSLPGELTTPALCGKLVPQQQQSGSGSGTKTSQSHGGLYYFASLRETDPADGVLADDVAGRLALICHLGADSDGASGAASSA
jgi:serine/threonine-protein kinase